MVYGCHIMAATDGFLCGCRGVMVTWEIHWWLPRCGPTVFAFKYSTAVGSPPLAFSVPARFASVLPHGSGFRAVVAFLH